MCKAKLTLISVLHVYIILCLLAYSSGGKMSSKRYNQAAASRAKNADEETTTELSRKILADILHKDHIFQDIFLEHLAPLKLQFGHVCENPNEWEQRFEQKDFSINRHQGKVKWGDRNGHYGEQYWDLNH